jgi:glycosyltransferase involved in cell wall biosynthesis
MNRANALRMSIPLILKQDIAPDRLIIVDASADHQSVRTEVDQISEQIGFKNTIVLQSDAASLTRQRNIGLRLVEAPVVMFPDDDSMWHPGFASNVLKVYEADSFRPGRRRAATGPGAALIQEEPARERQGGNPTLSWPIRKTLLPETRRLDWIGHLDREYRRRRRRKFQKSSPYHRLPDELPNRCCATSRFR